MERVRRWLLKHLVPERVWPPVVQLDGVSIPVRGMPFSFGVKRILCDGSYEASERRLMNRAVRPGDAVLELGGSIGILATIAADKVGTSGRVVTVEASERLTRHSASRFANRQNVRVLTGLGFPVWLAPDSVRGSVFCDTGNSLGGRVVFRASGAGGPGAHEVYDLARVTRECRIDPTVLLVDIEGSEAVVLEPGMSLPPCVQHVIIELHPGLYGEEVERKIVAAFMDFGFHVAEEVSHVYLFSRSDSRAP
jgi:hypothetical protein